MEPEKGEIKSETKVSLGEKRFNEIKRLEHCTINNRSVNVGDLIFNLMTQVADHQPDFIEAYLPKFMWKLIKCYINSDYSRFWSLKGYAEGISRFSQTILDYDAPLLPRIFFQCVIKPLMKCSIIKVEDIKWLPTNIENIPSAKCHYALLFLFINYHIDQDDIDRCK